MIGSLIFKRGYRSIQHLNPELSTSIATKILSHALKNQVPQYGFKEISILNASLDLGYQNSSILSVFEKDPVSSLVHYNLSSKRLQLANEDLQTGDDNSEIAMLKKIITKRLELNKPIMSKYKELLSLMIMPQNVLSSIDELLKLADEICFLSNDNSNDFSWYSKRLTVAGIYVESELHMLQQPQDDISKSIQYMTEKVDEFDRLGKTYNNVEEWSVFTLMSLINLIKSQLARG